MIAFGKFDLAQYSNSFVVTDDNIAQLYSICGNNVFVLPHGEQCKSFASVEQLCQWLLQANAVKSDTIVALGGGCVGDVVGFVASIYKRGLNILYVPTTLLAMVDSAIGGKTAVNMCGVKNAVGTFVSGDTLIDTSFLRTLPTQQLQEGWGEIKKYAMLSSDIFRLYQQCDGTFNDKLIKACAQYKEQLVFEDRYDCGVRRKLNLGHTVAHALELDNDIPHGIAVEYGLAVELQLAQKLGLASKQYVDMMSTKLQLPCVSYNLCQYIPLMLQDKKNGKSGISFCLPKDNFEVCETAIDKDKLAELWQC